MSRINDTRPQYQSTPAEPKRGRKVLPRVGKKRRALKAVVDPERAAFVEEAHMCILCRLSVARHCHEIARGNAREAALSERRLQMPLCEACHTAIHESTKENWPPEKQIARRILWEIDETCRLYNEACGTAPTHVTTEGVIGFLMFRKRAKLRRNKQHES